MVGGEEYGGFLSSNFPVLFKALEGTHEKECNNTATDKFQLSGELKLVMTETLQTRLF
jgi:hypothetical protein